jgi:hypothetical protein
VTRIGMDTDAALAAAARYKSWSHQTGSDVTSIAAHALGPIEGARCTFTGLTFGVAALSIEVLRLQARLGGTAADLWATSDELHREVQRMFDADGTGLLDPYSESFLSMLSPGLGAIPGLAGLGYIGGVGSPSLWRSMTHGVGLGTVIHDLQLIGPATLKATNRVMRGAGLADHYLGTTIKKLPGIRQYAAAKKAWSQATSLVETQNALARGDYLTVADNAYHTASGLVRSKGPVGYLIGMNMDVWWDVGEALTEVDFHHGIPGPFGSDAAGNNNFTHMYVPAFTEASKTVFGNLIGKYL